MTNPKIFGGHQDGDINSLGRSPKYKANHEVYITRDLGSNWATEILAFIPKHIAEYNGKTEEEYKSGIPRMIFEKKADAEKFAKEMKSRLNIPHDHVSVKPVK